MVSIAIFRLCVNKFVEHIRKYNENTIQLSEKRKRSGAEGSGKTCSKQYKKIVHSWMVCEM